METRKNNRINYIDIARRTSYYFDDNLTCIRFRVEKKYNIFLSYAFIYYKWIFF